MDLVPWSGTEPANSKPSMNGLLGSHDGILCFGVRLGGIITNQFGEIMGWFWKGLSSTLAMSYIDSLLLTWRILLDS
jgi:hypothetical protein